MNDKLLGDLAARLAHWETNKIARAFERSSRALPGTAFAKLGLVTREEFDVQSEVLARASARVAERESRLAQARRPA